MVKDSMTRMIGDVLEDATSVACLFCYSINADPICKCELWMISMDFPWWWREQDPVSQDQYCNVQTVCIRWQSEQVFFPRIFINGLGGWLCARDWGDPTVNWECRNLLSERLLTCRGRSNHQLIFPLSPGNGLPKTKVKSSCPRAISLVSQEANLDRGYLV